MRRALSNVATTVSLLLCGTLVVLWMRSFWVKDSIEFQYDGVRWEVASVFERLHVGNRPQLALDVAALADLDMQFRRDAGRGRSMGVAEYLAERQRLMRRIKTWVPDTFGMPRPQLQLQQYELPHWPLVLAATILPAVRWMSWVKRRRRRARGLCVECGYDLRASPDRCPECGAVPTDASRAAA